MNFILPVVFKRLGKTQKCGCNGVPIHQNKLNKILFSKKLQKVLVKRGFRKCYKAFIIDFVFVINFDSNNNASITITFKKKNKWSYLAVNHSIEFLSYINYTAHKKDATFVPKICSEKTLLVAMQHEKSPIRKKV